MSEKIVTGIEVLLNKEIEKGITEKLNASCSKYYGKNKEIQNMISEKNFADTISRVTVTSNDGKVLMHIDPKDLNLVDEEYRVRFGEVCSEYFSEIASEYFNHGSDTGNKAKNLTKEKTIEIISEKTRVSQEISKYVVNTVAENLDALSKDENSNAYVKNILGNSLKDTTYEAAIEIIANKWTDFTKSEKSVIAEELGGVRNKSYVIALFDHVTEN